MAELSQSRGNPVYDAVKKTIDNNVFPGIPENYPLYKKFNLLRTTSTAGIIWELFQIILALIACGVYVAELYTNRNYMAVSIYQVIDTIITSFFTVDFALEFMSSPSLWAFITNISTYFDALTIIPYYIDAAGGSVYFSLAIFRFVRIFRLLRIMRLFRILRGFSGTSRQVFQLVVILICTIFVGAGIFQLIETDVKQSMDYKCIYSNDATLFKPSCSETQPLISLTNDNCDCEPKECKSFYNRRDLLHQPTGVVCKGITFFDAVYFLFVTVGTIGKY